MKTILIISYSQLHKDPRILRQIQALNNDYKIITAGYTPANIFNLQHYDINILAKENIRKTNDKIILFFYLFLNLLRFHSKYLDYKYNLKNVLSYNINTPDFIIANDWDGLYLASKLKKIKKWNSNIYFDAHEYAPLMFNNSFKWKIFNKPLIKWSLMQCKNDIKIMSTVCSGIAREYERFFKFPEGFIRIITNSTEYISDLKPTNII